MKRFLKYFAFLTALAALLGTLSATALAKDAAPEVSIVFASEVRLDVYVDNQWSDALSERYGFGESVTLTAPAVSGKQFSHWEADGSVISCANPLNLTINAHTTLFAVYASDAPTAQPTAGFTSITRTNDGSQISFQAIASDDTAGIVYSTTATGDALTIGGSGVTDVKAEKLTSSTTEMPESVLDSNNCWMLQITPESGDAVYHARAYVTTDGTTTYGEEKSVSLSALESGIMLAANLDSLEPEGSADDILEALVSKMHTVAYDPNGGVGAAIVEAFQGTPVTLRANTFTRKDYFFTGWSTTPTGSVTYTDGQSVTLSGDTTLYAQWGQPAATVDTAPAAKKLTYNGQAQELVSEGKASGGTLVYSTAKDGSYSADIPTGKDAKTYTVWYMVQGDKQHSDSAPESVEVTIAPKVIGLKWSNTSFTSDGKPHVPTAEATGLVSGDTCTVTVTGEQTKAGEYTAKATELSNANYKLPANVEQKFTITGGDSDSTYDTLTADEKKTADDVAKALGVDKDTAAQMVLEAEKLGVSADILKLSEKTLAQMDVDSKDAKGSSFVPLRARAYKRGSTSQTLQWKKTKGADGYLIYGNQCGKKYKVKLLKTVKSNKISKDGKTFTAKLKKLKKGTYYKFMVVAYKSVNGKKMPIAASVTVHSPTTGGKASVAKSLKVERQTKDKKGKKVWKKVSELTVKKGKSVTIKATEVLEKKQKAKYKPHRKLKFVSSNPKIVKISGKGKITGKKKGKATIYVYNQNGLYKTVKVTVK